MFHGPTVFVFSFPGRSRATTTTPAAAGRRLCGRDARRWQRNRWRRQHSTAAVGHDDDSEAEMSRQPRSAGPVGTRVRVDRHHARHSLGCDRPRLIAAHRVAHVAGGRTRRTAAGPAVPHRVSECACRVFIPIAVTATTNHDPGRGRRGVCDGVGGRIVEKQKKFENIFLKRR